MKSTVDLERLFFEVSEHYLKENNCFDTRGELGVFSQAAVVWLGIQQRLSGNSLSASMSSLIERIREDTSPLNLALRPGKKIREGSISPNTGGISRARERLPEQLVNELFDAATENIELKLNESSNIYVLDGQVLTITRTASTLQEFGSTGNGEGELHFPRMRVVSVHHMQSGIAKGVAIGTWHDSEVTLAAELIARLPKGSIVVMDRFFEKPTFLAALQKNKLHAVVRVRDSMAKKFFGRVPQEPCCEKDIVWIPASKSLKHIEIPGKIVKFTAAQSGFRTSEFYFFSTSPDLSLDEVAALYRQRVRVEIFIRQLKQTLKMFFIKAKKAQNIRKEIFIAYLTFNLLRAVMQSAAGRGNFEPERMSFTAAINLTKAYAFAFLKAKTTAEVDKLTALFVTNMGQAQLPKRNKQRSYPRAVKLPRNKYPARAIVKTYNRKDGR